MKPFTPLHGLVAPLDRKGSTRKVVLPQGQWIADDGKTFEGGASYDLNVPLDRIPYFRLLEKSREK